MDQKVTKTRRSKFDFRPGSFFVIFSKMDQKLIRKNRFPDEIKNEFQKSDFSNMIQK